MHDAALSLAHAAPVLAAAKSKVSFYIFGGALVVWALTVSMAIGMRSPKFPESVAAQRAVIAISAMLVVCTMATAVATSGGAG